MTVIEKQSAMLEQEAPRQQTETKPKPLSDDYWEGELVPRADVRAAFISVNPERMSGTPCFVGTRVPIKHLWDYLEGSDTLEEFLDDFEGVPRDEVITSLASMPYEKLHGGLARRDTAPDENDHSA